MGVVHELGKTHALRNEVCRRAVYAWSPKIGLGRFDTITSRNRQTDILVQT